MLDPSDQSVWTDYGDRSYVATRLMWFTGLRLECPVQAHRTAELYLKAFLVSQGLAVRRGEAWGHDLATLYDLAVERVPEFGNEDASRRLTFLNRYFEYIRYPSEPASPDDGSLVWFGFEHNVLLIYEITAYLRPRIEMDTDSCGASHLMSISDQECDFQFRALTDNNNLLAEILCSETYSSDVPFGQFDLDEEGC